MMAIEMTGGVYCALSPRDPRYRLHELVQQTRSPLVLTHFLTKLNLMLTTLFHLRLIQY